MHCWSSDLTGEKLARTRQKPILRKVNRSRWQILYYQFPCGSHNVFCWIFVSYILVLDHDWSLITLVYIVILLCVVTFVVVLFVCFILRLLLVSPPPLWFITIHRWSSKTAPKHQDESFYSSTPVLLYSCWTQVIRCENVEMQECLEILDRSETRFNRNMADLEALYLGGLVLSLVPSIAILL